MKKYFQILLGACLSSGLVFPLVLAGTTSYLEAIFVSLVTLAVYIHQIWAKEGSLIAFQISIIFGTVFSIGFIILDLIDNLYNVRDDFFFLATFVVSFSFLVWLTFVIKKYQWRTLFFSLLNAVSFCSGLVLILLVKNLREHLIWVLTMGFLVGIIMGSIGGLLFQFYLEVISKIFENVVNYIEALFKPCLIFFMGYGIIALVFTGIYYLMYLHNPSSLTIPEEQPLFLSLLVYSFNAMSTGGDSRISAYSMGAQTLNSINVFVSIVWMTVMLAAAISYSSETFENIKKLHDKKRKAALRARKNAQKKTPKKTRPTSSDAT